MGVKQTTGRTVVRRNICAKGKAFIWWMGGVKSVQKKTRRLGRGK